MAHHYGVVKFDTTEAVSMVSELEALYQRRRSLPEFVQRVREIADLIPQGFETVRVDLDEGSAGAGVAVFALKVAQPLLDRLAALRAFDRDFDLIGQAHG